MLIKRALIMMLAARVISVHDFVLTLSELVPEDGGKLNNASKAK